MSDDIYDNDNRDENRCGPTHYFACDCREARVAKLVEALRGEIRKLESENETLRAELAKIVADAKRLAQLLHKEENISQKLVEALRGCSGLSFGFCCCGEKWEDCETPWCRRARAALKEWVESDD